MARQVALLNPFELARVVDPDAGDHLRLGLDPFQALESRAFIDLTKAIYDELAQRRISYNIEPVSRDEHTQSIRETTEVLYGGVGGTCIDLAVLFCGACLTYGLLPLLVVQNGHAIVGVSERLGRREWSSEQRRKEERFDRGSPTLQDRGFLIHLLQRQRYRFIDCMGFVEADDKYRFLPAGLRSFQRQLTFDQARQAAEDQIFTNAPEFVVALDIETLHRVGFAPPRAFPASVSATPAPSCPASQALAPFCRSSRRGLGGSSPRSARRWPQTAARG